MTILPGTWAIQRLNLGLEQWFISLTFQYLKVWAMLLWSIPSTHSSMVSPGLCQFINRIIGYSSSNSPLSAISPTLSQEPPFLVPLAKTRSPQNITLYVVKFHLSGAAIWPQEQKKKKKTNGESPQTLQIPQTPFPASSGQRQVTKWVYHANVIKKKKWLLNNSLNLNWTKLF